MAKDKSAQEFVPIKEIRNGVVVLRDGSLRSVLLASSLNFALKSANEQNAILSQFQNFLNSLEFSVQFFIQSRDLDIRPYLSILEERYSEQTIELMKIQTREYIDFIKNFVEGSNIMAKNFFIIVPYNPSVFQQGKGGVVGKFLGKNKKESAETRGAAAFEENRSQLEQRMSVVEQGLSRTGIRTVQLGTEELVELYYKILNPGELGKPMPAGQDAVQ